MIKQLKKIVTFSCFHRYRQLINLSFTASQIHYWKRYARTYRRLFYVLLFCCILPLQKYFLVQSYSLLLTFNVSSTLCRFIFLLWLFVDYPVPFPLLSVLQHGVILLQCFVVGFSFIHSAFQALKCFFSAASSSLSFVQDFTAEACRVLFEMMHFLQNLVLYQ